MTLFLPLVSCASLGRLLSLSELQPLHVHKNEPSPLNSPDSYKNVVTKVQASYITGTVLIALPLIIHLFPTILLREVLLIFPFLGN